MRNEQAVNTIPNEFVKSKIHEHAYQKDLGEMETLVRLGKKIWWSKTENWCKIGDITFNVSRKGWEKFWYQERRL